MTWQTIPLQDCQPTPWKNGGGTTRELVAWPSNQDWLWRMSVAEVTQSGPFSRFEGIDRWFAVLHGDGVALATNGSRQTLTNDSAPFFFDGGLATDCTLVGGPTRDFNLMMRQGAAKVSVRRLRGSCSVALNTTELIAIYSTNTGAIVHFDSQTVESKPHSLLWQVVDKPGLLQVASSDALVIHMAITPAAMQASNRNDLESAA